MNKIFCSKCKSEFKPVSDSDKSCECGAQYEDRAVFFCSDVVVFLDTSGLKLTENPGERFKSLYKALGDTLDDYENYKKTAN